MEEHEAGGGRSYEGGNVRGGELVDAFEVPEDYQSHLREGRRVVEARPIHLVIGPLHLIHKIQATVYDERIHMASLWTETGDAISTLLGRAKFELE